jgi:hypothetical protein
LKLTRISPIFLAAQFLLAAPPPLRADEGMWMPQQIPELAARLKAMGFAGDPKAFADLTGQPMGAIVSLGGCTASFVSPDGLIVTNHHCVTGHLQFNSTPQRNLLQDGYLAKTREEELSGGPTARVFVTTSVTEVTNAITGNIDPKSTDRQRFELIERRIKERVAACEKSGQRCTVASFFEGHKYFEISQLEIRDARLVYAPTADIGTFGGETDNWRWPRHTGDWSYLRAYVAPDGKSATYAKENVPYKPKHWLRVSAAGLKENDLVFVVGYPGRTQRYQTYSEVKETTDWSMPLSIKLAEEQIALLEKITNGNRDLTIKAAARVRGLNNGLTNQKGMLEGLVKGGALALKESREKELVAWINADPALKEKYGDVLGAMAALQAEAEKTRERNSVLGGLSGASSYLAAAQTLYRLANERPKPDLEREGGYQERDWVRIKEGQERTQRTLDPTLDRGLLRWAMGRGAILPRDQRIEPLDALVGLKPDMVKADAEKAIDSYLDTLYAGTKMGDLAFRMRLFEMSKDDCDSTEDSFMRLAIALHPLGEANREAAKNRQGAYLRLRPRYMEAVLANAGGLAAPDANSTLRVTYGQVKSVAAKDGVVWTPFTTLKGVVAKHTGEGEFNAPEREREAVKALRAGKTSPYVDAGLKDVPVNFLSTVDTTGGNSGSPTLNARGELVGLLFDGTYETVASNYLFDPILTRSIHVDARYMLWTMTEVDGAQSLLRELGIK